MSSLRIAVNGRAFSVDEPGGDVQAGINLVRSLDRLPDIELVVYGHESLRHIVDECGVEAPYFPIDSQLYGLLWEQVVPAHSAEEMDADLLFCPNGNGPVRATKVPVVTNIQAIFGYLGMAPKAYAYLQRFRAPRVARRADGVLTVSNYAKAEIVSNFDIDPDEVAVVYNGVDDLYRSKKKGKVVDVPDRYLLFVGGQNRRKNLTGLLDAYRLLDGRFGVEIDLVIVGPTSKYIYERETLDEQDERRIHRFGFVEAAELKYLYDHAEAFVFPSLFETFGLPPLEAMACATPVVSSNRGSLPEILGDAAHFVDPSDPGELASGIRTVLEAERYRRKLIRQGTRQAEKYSWERAAGECRRVFEQVIGV